MRSPLVRAGLGAGLLALLLVGCSRSTSPVASRSVEGSVIGALRAGATHGDFYPLVGGNWWHYQRRYQVSVGGDLVEDYRATMTDQIVCAQSWMDREYLVDRGVETASDGQVFRSWVLARQDASGLFEADTYINVPPACDIPIANTSTRATAGAPETQDAPDAVEARLQSIADPARRTAVVQAWRNMQARIALVRDALGPSGSRGGGPLPRELHRLSYPLHPGTRWFIRDEGTVKLEAIVEAQETLHLPSGAVPCWRISLVWHGGAFGPTDRILAWYSRSGLMRVYYRLEDATGLVAENDQVCDDFVLASAGLLQ